MLHGISTFRYYLFSISNLLAAFGGGLILGKGAGIIDYPYLQGGSILSFFIGSILGLVFLQFIPKRLSNWLAQSFSISGGITSIILFYIYQNYSFSAKLTGTPALIFFVFLSIRFGFWFYSRVMRAANASKYQHSIAWVEFGYYLGMVLGLILWKLLGIDIALNTALIIDAVFQFVAGIIDLRNFKLEKNPSDELQQETKRVPKPASTQYSFQWCWKLAAAVVFITMGIQVVIFNAAHEVPSVQGSYILAIFYLGVAASAFICSRYKIDMSWCSEYKMALIRFNSPQKSIQFRLLSLIIILAIAVYMVTNQIYLSDSFHNSTFLRDLMVYVLVFVAAFIFELVSLSLLHRIEHEESLLNGSGMIMRTYGLMSVGAALGFWTLGLADDHLTSSLITTGVCLIFAAIMVLKRNLDTFNLNQTVL